MQLIRRTIFTVTTAYYDLRIWFSHSRMLVSITSVWLISKWRVKVIHQSECGSVMQVYKTGHSSSWLSLGTSPRKTQVLSLIPKTDRLSECHDASLLNWCINSTFLGHVLTTVMRISVYTLLSCPQVARDFTKFTVNLSMSIIFLVY